jgi:hypothetical protein
MKQLDSYALAYLPPFSIKQLQGQPLRSKQSLEIGRKSDQANLWLLYTANDVAVGVSFVVRGRQMEIPFRGF